MRMHVTNRQLSSRIIILMFFVMGMCSSGSVKQVALSMDVCWSQRTVFFYA